MFRALAFESDFHVHLDDLNLVVEGVFSRLVEQAATRGPLDSTDLEALAWNNDTSWNYDLTVEEFYYGFCLSIVSAGPKIPIVAEFTQAKQASKETAMRVICDALAVKHPIWLLGDSAYYILSRSHRVRGSVCLDVV